MASRCFVVGRGFDARRPTDPRGIRFGIAPLIPGLNPSNLPLYVLILVGIARVLDDVVFQPFVLGSAVNIHPLVVVVAIIGGSLILGLWGMVFAIPTVVVVKTAVETLFKELKDYRMI